MSLEQLSEFPVEDFIIEYHAWNDKVCYSVCCVRSSVVFCMYVCVCVLCVCVAKAKARHAKFAESSSIFCVFLVAGY